MPGSLEITHHLADITPYGGIVSMRKAKQNVSNE